MPKPLAVDLFCGLGGWTDGLIAEGFYVVGFDIERHVYGDHKYPAQLVLQDVLTLHGSQFKEAALIVASPPCQEYSYMAMPWKVAKQRAHEYRIGVRDVKDLTRLFDSCFRIQREASGAAGHHIPLVVENVRGANPWVGRSRWNFGSFHLWGDVPALMPMTFKGHKVPSFRFDGSGKSFQTAAVEGVKAGDAGWRERGPGRQLQDRAIKNNGGSWFNIGSPGQKVLNKNPVHDGTKCSGDTFGIEVSMGSRHGSHKRKFASAMIAKIPTPLSRHIARTYYPKEATT